jgi:hypothetical protein
MYGFYYFLFRLLAADSKDRASSLVHSTLPVARGGILTVLSICFLETILRKIVMQVGVGFAYSRLILLNSTSFIPPGHSRAPVSVQFCQDDWGGAHSRLSRLCPSQKLLNGSQRLSPFTCTHRGDGSTFEVSLQ